MNKKIIIGLVALGVLGGIFYLGTLFKIVPQTIVNNLGAVTGPDNSFPCTSQNGVITCISSGSFTDSTTTIVSIASPTVATATVDFVQLINTGVATSTYSITCGVGPSASAYPTRTFGDSDSISTSTDFGTISNFLVNNQGSMVNLGTTTPNGARLLIGSSEYFVCKANTQNDIPTHNAAFSGTNNTFDGNFKVRFVR